MPVRDAVVGGEPVEAGPVGRSRSGEADPVGVDAEPDVLGLQRVGRAGHEGGVHRDSDRGSLEPDHPRVGGAGPAGPALEGGVDPQTLELEVDYELGQRHCAIPITAEGGP